jgi:hypothetical protein
MRRFAIIKGNSLVAVRSDKWKPHTINGKPTQLGELKNDIGASSSGIGKSCIDLSGV